ncbi:helix-turn-helix domain-containing protein [Modestobacter roseus]|nr:helix-turn-helix domain-containing protein [Modestobacter roseus]
MRRTPLSTEHLCPQNTSVHRTPRRPPTPPRRCGTLRRVDDDQPAAGLLRRLRREADLSQRELAQATGLTQARIARVETGRSDLGVGALVRIAAVAGARVALLHADGSELPPMTGDAATDRAGRRFPAHLDLRHGDEDWWADEVRYTRRRPEFTFDRDRSVRDRGRATRGTASDHPVPYAGDSLAERAVERRRAAFRAAAAERERRLAEGWRPRPLPELLCTCPPACDVLLAAGERWAHVEECPCRCDVG